jgi:hypothetical protein
VHVASFLTISLAPIIALIGPILVVLDKFWWDINIKEHNRFELVSGHRLIIKRPEMRNLQRAVLTAFQPVTVSPAISGGKFDVSPARDEIAT